MQHRKFSLRSWEKDVKCPGCGIDRTLQIADLYAETQDKKLVVYTDCSCGRRIKLHGIPEAIIHSLEVVYN